jgi:NitT/TauT family transport system substrate-binding protein
MMTDKFTTAKALGWIDPVRMQSDYDLVQTYLGMEKPFDVKTASRPATSTKASRWIPSKVKY